MLNASFSFLVSDVNECLHNNGGCHHHCCNTLGSFYCRCNPGYKLNSDGRTCSGKALAFEIFLCLTYFAKEFKSVKVVMNLHFVI